ncbi:hypothetical protein ACFY36_17125, partial [Actinoplanes sp. NPDC000266]
MATKGTRADRLPAETLPVARVCVDVPLPHLDRLFDYLVASTDDEAAKPGVRVKVRFAGQLVSGFLLERAETSPHGGKLAYLEKVVSPEQVLDPEITRLARAIADRYAGNLCDVLRLAVPPRHARVEAQLTKPAVTAPEGAAPTAALTESDTPPTGEPFDEPGTIATTAPPPPTTSAASSLPAASTEPSPPTTSAAPSPPPTSAASPPPTTSTTPSPPPTSAASPPPTTSTTPSPPAANAAPPPPTTSTTPSPPAANAAPPPPAVSTASLPPLIASAADRAALHTADSAVAAGASKAGVTDAHAFTETRHLPDSPSSSGTGGVDTGVNSAHAGSADAGAGSTDAGGAGSTDAGAGSTDAGGAGNAGAGGAGAGGAGSAGAGGAGSAGAGGAGSAGAGGAG